MDTLLELDLPQMTAEEFLATDQRAFGEGRFELIDGRVVAMAPPSDRHQDIQHRIQVVMDAAIRAAGLPCRVRPTPRVQITARHARVRSPDVAVLCGSPLRYKVFFEILSPSNKGPVYEDRLRDLRDVDGLEEIVELAQDKVFARVLRRSGEEWREDKACGEDAVLELRSLGLGVRMAEFYVDLPFEGEDLA